MRSSKTRKTQLKISYRQCTAIGNFYSWWFLFCGDFIFCSLFTRQTQQPFYEKNLTRRKKLSVPPYICGTYEKCHGGVKCVLNSIRLSTLEIQRRTHTLEYQHPLAEAGVHKIQNYSCLTIFPPPARSRNYTPASPLRGSFSRKKCRKRRWTESSLREGRLTAGVPFFTPSGCCCMARREREREVQNNS